jgi:exopolysaccharide transport family protein
MLQSGNTKLIVDKAQPERPEQGEVRHFLDFALGLLRRQYLFILFFTLLGVGAGLIYLRITPPTYTATAQIIMGTQSAPFIQQQSMFADRAIDSPQLESQIQIVKSRAIASKIVDELELAHDELVTSGVGSIRQALAALGYPSASMSQLEKREAAITGFIDGLKVNRVGLSYVIEISFSCQNAAKAAQVANAVANAYIADQIDHRHQANHNANAWLRERSQELREQSEVAEREVVAFRKEHDIISADGKLMNDQRVMDLSARLVAARAQTADLLARLDRIEAFIRNGSADAAFDSGVADGSTTSILTNLRQQYLELARREAEYAARFGREHLAVVNLRSRMRVLRASTVDELRRIAETYRSDYEIAKQRQEEIEKQLASAVSESQTTNKAQVALRELEGKAKTLRTLHEAFVQREMASVQQESFPTMETRLLSVAATPTSKSKPKTMLVLALAVMGGIGLGGGVALLRDVLHRGFRTGAQLQVVLEMPCLAVVPLLKGKEGKLRPRRKVRGDEPVEERMIAEYSGAFWNVVDSPSARFAESIRSINSAINLNVTSTSNRVVGFTSSLPNEGKSTIAAAFALLARQLGRRVIIVDCDLRNPSLSRSLAPKSTIGLADVISGASRLEDAIWRDSTSNLSFLPAVKKESVFRDSELLVSASAEQLFDKLRAGFDYVIVDLPPLVPLVDVRVTAHLLDCAILVVEWGHTKIDVVRHALNTAPNIQEVLIGAILNKTDMDRIRHYDAEYGALYHSKYYTRYC